MPWKVADVEEHKKGLTDAQKRRWVEVANAARRSCLDKGGSESACDASAIRQANSVVNNNAMETTVERFCVHSVAFADYRIQERTLNHRKHLVVPVVMMVEGVHRGSHGAVYHRSEELAKFVGAWNGIPVTASHPNKDGENVSANSPEMFEQFQIGQIFNTHFEDGKLKAEVWIDEQRAIAVSPNALAAIRQGRPLEVSVGVFSNTLAIEGEWHGETYESVASDYRPDHLALLPGERGACSWDDGCGIRVNKEGGNMEELLKTFKTLNEKGFTVSPITNDQGYQELLRLLQSKFDTMDNGERVHYLEEVYPNYLVYQIRTAEGRSSFYKRGYTVDGSTVTFSEDPVEVRKEISYVAMKKMQRTKDPNINNDKNGGKMSDNGGTPCCEGKVDNLIANKRTRFTAADREWLLTLDESTIDKLSPMEPEKKKEEVPPVQVNKDQVIDEFKNGLKTIEDYAALMPEDMKATVVDGVRLYNERRESLVKDIMENAAKDTWEKDELEAMNTTMLEKIAKTVNKKADYSGMGAPPATHASGEEKLLPAGFGKNGKEEK
jgi:hypothetical protein